MKRVPGIEMVGSIGFVALISSVALIQAGAELPRGERPQVLELFTRAPTVANLRAYETDLEEASVVNQTLRSWIQYAQFVVLGDAGEKALVGRDGWVFYKPALQYLTERPPLKTSDAGRAQPLEAILAFRDQLAAQGIHLLAVPVPNKESVYPEMLTRRADQQEVIVCRQTRQLLEELRASGVEVVDLFETFRRAKQQRGSDDSDALYLVQDTHWSPAGLAVAARAVAEHISERAWIRPGALQYQQKPVRLERIGDLLEMARVPQIERHMGPERILCMQVIRRDTGTPYQDAPDAEILILGDSFLRVFQRDEPQAAGFIAQLAHQLGQPLTSIVNDGGASTLVRQELYRRGELLANKKLVIWEFVERDLRFGTEGWQIVPLPPQ
ncbi:MAG: hypothetical protein JSW71_07355 [Gemmatimonadota bacterium]|nr:MAG: hypothetical protein JSW71_07355 [Gemmatimonadota bacterium]